MHSSNSSASQRALSIDVLRGFALICMVIIHFLVYFGNPEAVNTWLYFSFNHLLGDWGASVFLILMGASQVFSGDRHIDLDDRLLFKRSLIRGLFIFVAGLVMLALAWGPFRIWQWDILTLMGAATVVLFFCRRLPSGVILMMALAIALCSPFLRGQLDIALAWNKSMAQVPVISQFLPHILFDPAGELEMAGNVKNVVTGFLLTGEFPVFPWMLFPLVGYVLGRRMKENRIYGDMPLIFISGIVLVGLGLGLAYAASMRPGASVIDDYIAPLSFYPDSFSIVFLQLGLSAAFVALMYFIFDVRRNLHPPPGAIAGFFIRTSQSSLTFYFLHYLLIGWPLALIYFVTGHYERYNLMGAWPAFACGVAAVVLLFFVLKQWQKSGGKYTLEWLLGMALQLAKASGKPRTDENHVS